MCCALAFGAAACSGSEFTSDGSGGAAGSGGADAGGGNGGGAGSGGASGAGASAGGGASGSSGAGGTPAIIVVQSTPIELDNASDVYALTLTTPPTAGNAIIVGITCFSEVDNCTIPDGGVADNQGNGYALVQQGASVVSSTTHGARPYLFIAENIGVPSGPFVITADPNGSAPANYQHIAWGAIEVAGLATAPSLDQTGGTPVGSNASTTVSTDAAILQGNELAVAVLTDRTNDNDANIVPETGWTQHHVNQDGQSTALPHSMVSRVIPAAGVVSHTWTHDEPTRGASAIIATFRGAN